MKVGIKQNIHKLVEITKNKSLLDVVYSILNEAKNKQENIDWIELLSGEQKKDLKVALKEIEEEKEFVPHSLVMEEAQKWIKKKK